MTDKANNSGIMAQSDFCSFLRYNNLLLASGYKLHVDDVFPSVTVLGVH